MNKTIIYLFFSIMLFACSQQPAQTEEEPAEDITAVTLTAGQVQQAGIETGAVTKQTLHIKLNVNGVVDVPPQNIVSVSFPMGGYLKTTDLLPGMHVNRGQVIGVIEDKSLIQLQQDYLVAETRLQYLQKDYERQKTLNENKVNADKVLQQAEAEFAGQKVLVKSLGEKLKLININPGKLNENTISRSVPVYSPINGFVSKVNVNIGRFVAPTDVLFELINPDDMHAALTVFEKDMPLVKEGQPVKVSFIDNPGEEYDCGVILVTRNVDDNRSGIVHCHFEKMPKKLLPGMFLEATIIVGDVEALTVPEEAVVRYAGQEYVLLANGGNTYELVAVKTGVKEDNRIQVSSESVDLFNKRVVVKNAYTILGKMKNEGEEE